MAHTVKSGLGTALFGAMLVGISGQAFAQPTIVAQGRTLAVQQCGTCHAVDGQGESPHRASPPFRTFAENYPIDMLQSALRTGIISGHDEMPSFELEPREMAALMAYIDSLAPLRRRYLSGPRTP